MAFSTRLFVGNLPENFKDDALRKEFSVYGDITNIDVKTKPGTENDKKVFAFINISASNYNVESCIKHFSDQDFYGQRLYVTRARESFLERLQRERDQTQQNSTNKVVTENLPVIQKPVEKLNKNINNKRKFNENDTFDLGEENNTKIATKLDSGYHRPLNLNKNINNKQKFDENNKTFEVREGKTTKISTKGDSGYQLPQPHNRNDKNGLFQNDDKKFNADRKRLESIKRKRQEFIEKKKIIKTGLTSIDKQANKKVIFSDMEKGNLQENETVMHSNHEESNVKSLKHKVNLFDDDGSDDETNFDMKKQFEGKKGQKVLELQSRYKADKRFTLDDRFVEDGQSENENEEVDLEQVDEKSKQLDILQDVLGVSIKARTFDVKDKTKMKPGMLRFDPTHPEHTKFLAPVEQKPESKKAKKKRNKELQEEIAKNPPVVEKVEVSNEQFYKISDTLKEAITQPKEFSLRSLFTNDNVNEEEPVAQSTDFIPLVNNKDKRVRNPLDTGDKNPFVYDSSDSENEDDLKDAQNTDVQSAEPKVVWREKLFFVDNDNRLEDGLLFFTKKSDSEAPKDRRELKSLMKKRIYNKERKNHMFKKKIGGRKKTMKKSFRKKS